MMKKIAVYAGSFDPVTLGHLDVIQRVAPIFDQLVVLVAHNYRKKYFFNADERVSLLKKLIKNELKDYQNITVDLHSGLLVDYCANKKINILVRGLRVVSDFEHEFLMATMNRRLRPGIETFHVMTDEKYFFVSSTTVKEVAYHGGSLKGLVHPTIEKAIKEKINNDPSNRRSQ